MLIVAVRLMLPDLEFGGVVDTVEEELMIRPELIDLVAIGGGGGVKG